MQDALVQYMQTVRLPCDAGDSDYIQELDALDLLLDGLLKALSQVKMRHLFLPAEMVSAASGFLASACSLRLCQVSSDMLDDLQ